MCIRDRINRIKDVSYDDDVAVVFIADFDQYLPEYEVQDYLDELKDEDENED